MSEPTSHCYLLDACPLFKEFKDTEARAIWIEVYCLGPSQTDCARRKLREAGQMPPANLLPSGHRLERSPR